MGVAGVTYITASGLSNVLMRVFTHSIGIYGPKVAVGEEEKGVFSEEK